LFGETIVVRLGAGSLNHDLAVKLNAPRQRGALYRDVPDSGPNMLALSFAEVDTTRASCASQGDLGLASQVDTKRTKVTCPL
jgi:hypothetical protein